MRSTAGGRTARTGTGPAPRARRRIGALLAGAVAASGLALAATSAPGGGSDLGTTTNGAAIAIPAAGTDGPANPYPSTIEVTGVVGAVTDVKVIIPSASHTYPDDLDVLLVGPTGASVLLMSDVGGVNALAGTALRFTDGGSLMPDATAVPSGSYQPTNYGDGDAFPAPAPAGPSSSNLGVFDGTDPNGTWQLFVVDDLVLFGGSFANGWRLDLITGRENETPLAIPGAGTSGPASPYPSTINVVGQAGLVTDVTVSLPVLNHPWANDLDVLLVGPTGASVVLMSDVGVGFDFVQTSLTFADGAPPLVGVTSGRFSPTNNGPGDVFPPPAPPGPHGTALSVFDGTDPNGAWQLFVVDDAGGDVGNLLTGWSLDVRSTAAPPPPPPPACTGSPATVFTDLGGLSAENIANIECIVAFGITQGVTATAYGPTFEVSRAQIASFTARTIDAATGPALPGAPPNAFTDDSPPHEVRINQLAAVGVIGGNGESGVSYFPTQTMRRDHMASFLFAAFQQITGAPLPAGPDVFGDDAGNPHEAAINALAAAGIVNGTGPVTYSPANGVSRAQMASFLARFINLLGAEGAL